MGEITQFPGLYYGDTPADNALEQAKSWDMEAVLIIGQKSDGELCIGANFSEMKDMLWLVMRALWFLERQEAASCVE